MGHSVTKAVLLMPCLGLIAWTSMQVFPPAEADKEPQSDIYWTDGQSECVLMKQYKQVVCYPVNSTIQL